MKLSASKRAISSKTQELSVQPNNNFIISGMPEDDARPTISNVTFILKVIQN
jgi:hypothetical protein